MRILVLLPSLLDLIGGIQTYSQALVWSLDDLAQPRGWKVKVLALHDKAKSSGVSGLDLPNVRHRGFAGSKVQFALATLGAAPSADVIIMAHIHFVPLMHAIRWLAPAASCRVSAHGIEVWKPLGTATRSALGFVDEIWPVSDYTRRRMIQENPALSGKRFALLPNTLGPSYPPAGKIKSRAELGLPSGPLLLCVSRMASEEPYKNVELLVRAMPDVLRQRPDSVLLLVGPGDDRPRLEALVHQLGLKDQVMFAGRLSDEDLQSFLAACDLFVLPSTGEGFGIVYLEAMYHSKACIGATAGGVPEVIEDGVTGLLVDASRPEQLTEAVLRLLQDEGLRGRMGIAGKQRLEQSFSLERFRATLQDLLVG